MSKSTCRAQPKKCVTPLSCGKSRYRKGFGIDVISPFFIPEGSGENVFVVRNGEIYTPPLSASILPGITREFLFEVGAERAIPVREAVLRDEDLFAADEAFLTSTTRELVPIVRVDDRPIGAGTPGPVTRALLAAFRTKAHELAQAQLALKR